MLFSSMVFLWLFLPVAFILYRIIGKKGKNVFLLLVSLLFYAWGEPIYIFLMLAVILLNFIFGLILDKTTKYKKITLILCVASNLMILGYYKYFDFMAINVNRMFGPNTIELKNIVLPIGISFFTFQTLSYVIDLYRGEIKVQKNLINLALYTSFFPQLIAGPIVKYHDIDEQIENREITAEKTAYGIKRFIYGLSKKVILSNSFAYVVDDILGRDIATLSGSAMWLAIFLYTLQIYYDFSGYSDMAIGLAKMFGFDLHENFDYPYISKSITEFWRRWHISLSTWFKEYVYIPLGGNRKGKVRTYINLFVVFLLTGVWHGASFNFIAWGLLHGFFNIIEKLGLLKILDKNKVTGFVGHIYTLFVVVMGWTLFRAPSLLTGLSWYKLMLFGNSSDGYIHMASDFIDTKLIFFIIVGILLCGLLQSVFAKIKEILFEEKKVFLLESVVQMVLLTYCVMLLVNNTYNPFIYFKF